MKIKTLTGLRFVFCFMVFLHHLDMFNNLNIPGWDGVMKYFFEGFVGVNFFFILSGFVISYAYGQKITKKILSGGSFIFYRFAKLWPLHVITLITTLILYQTTFNSSVAIHIFMFQSLIPNAIFSFSYNGVAWCISVEMVFYFMFLFFAPASTKRLSVLLVGLVTVVTLAINFVGFDASYGNYMYYISPVFRSIDFIVGILLQRMISKRPTAKKMKKNKCHILEISSVLLLVWFMWYAVQYNINVLWRYDLYYIFPIVFIVYSFQFEEGILSRVLSSRLFQFLGEISFAFYLVHQIILGQIRVHFGQYIVSIGSAFAFAAISFALSVVIGTVLYYLIERPANQALRKTWDHQIVPFANKAKELLVSEVKDKS